MKNLSLIIAICFALFVTSCKKETVVEETVSVQPDGSTVTTTKTTTDYDMMVKQAESDYQAAEHDVIVARERGDTKAETIAQNAAAKAKTAWENVKADFNKGKEKTKDALQELKEDTKEGYNKTLEKAKAK